jgi:hypothetical protein
MFAGCDNLKSVVIPDSITYIDDQAFSGCTALTSIVMGGNIETIGESAFECCENLSDITLPESVTSIAKRAFFKCSKLNSIRILNPECKIYNSEDTICDSVIEATGQCHYNGIIYGYEGSTAQIYAEKYSYAFAALDSMPVQGDVNADGILNVADAVALQKWLLGVPDTHLANWKDADLCEDDRLDVFDLCLMKRELLKIN